MTILLTENGYFNGGVSNAERGCLEEGDAGKSSHCKTGSTELRDEELIPEIVSQHACQTCKADVVFDPALVNAAAARQPAVHAFYLPSPLPATDHPACAIAAMLGRRSVRHVQVIADQTLGFIRHNSLNKPGFIALDT